MSIITQTLLLGALANVARVAAHGVIQGIIADGEWYPGYSPWTKPAPVLAAWSTPTDLDNGPVYATQYGSPDIICHNASTPGGTYINVTAGTSIELQWTDWAESHHGPILTYLAACGEDCTNIDKTTLKFNKFDEGGLLNDTTPPGYWVTDELRANNNSWTVTIPSSVAPGKYVMRHEIIALHSAWNASMGGAQSYPQCINLEISSTGTDPLADGTLGTSLYQMSDPGISINIYNTLPSGYSIPGPPLYTPVSPVSQSSSSAWTGSVTSVTDMPTKSPMGSVTTNAADYVSPASAEPTTTSTTTTTTTTTTTPSWSWSGPSESSTAAAESTDSATPMSTAPAWSWTPSAWSPPASPSSPAAPENTDSATPMSTAPAWPWTPSAWSSPSSSSSPAAPDSTDSATPMSTAPAWPWTPSAWSSPSSSSSPAAPENTDSATPMSTAPAWSWTPSAWPSLSSLSSPAAAESTNTVIPIEEAPSSLWSSPWPSSSAAAAVSSVGLSTIPVSFTSTVTGRIGKPTKFTCYIDDE